jgi:hypothetical protein
MIGRERESRLLTQTLRRLRRGSGSKLARPLATTQPADGR